MEGHGGLPSAADVQGKCTPHLWPCCCPVGAGLGDWSRVRGLPCPSPKILSPELSWPTSRASSPADSTEPQHKAPLKNLSDRVSVGRVHLPEALEGLHVTRVDAHQGSLCLSLARHGTPGGLVLSVVISSLSSENSVFLAHFMGEETRRELAQTGTQVLPKST